MNMTIVKYLVEIGEAVITTQSSKFPTPIRWAEKLSEPGIANYLKAQVKARIMKIDRTILPFYTDVRGIIVKYLQ